MITQDAPVRAPVAAPSAKPSANGRMAPAPVPVRRKRRGLRRAGWAAAAMAVLALAFWALSPSPLAIESAAVARGPLRVTVDEDGVTRVQDRYLISAPVAGRLLRVTLEEGDAVEPGRVVARVAAAPLDTRTADGG